MTRGTTARRLPVALTAVAALIAGHVTAASGAAAQQPAPSEVESLVAVTGSDQQLWLRWSQDPDWFPMAGRLIGAPALVYGPADIYMLGLGEDRNVWIRSFERNWRPFGPEGTHCEGVSAGRSGTTIVAVCRGADGALWQAGTALPLSSGGSLPRATDASGTGWRSLGGQIKHGAAVGDWQPDDETQPVSRYVAVGLDDRIWTRTGGSGWEPFSERRCGGVAAVSEHYRALACKALESDELRVWHLPSGTFTDVGGVMSGRVGISVDPNGATRYYVLGQDASVWVTRMEPDGATNPFRFFQGAGQGGLFALNMTDRDEPNG
jgi:hypothetical protein